MIANQRQYRITRAAAARFEESLGQLETAEAHRPVAVRRLLRAAMESQLDELREELAEYETLQAGHVAEFDLEGLRELPAALIRARIAAGVTQKELARRLGLKEQQIQRYEATQYGGVSLQRVQEVADALGLSIRETVTLPHPVPGPQETRHVLAEERRRWPDEPE